MREPLRAALAAIAALALSVVMIGPAPAMAQALVLQQSPASGSSSDTPIDADAPDALAEAFTAAAPSATVARMGAWAVSSGDNHGLPYIIVDKPAAEVFVFDSAGALLGAAPALLGVALGDDTAPGIGDIALSKIPLDERTTAAGRFVARLGPAEGMKNVLWVDFDSALSLHPVITSDPQEQRLQRLRSPSPEDRRITHGCINVPAAFYQNVVHKTFAGTAGVVYILPDSRPLEEVFPDFGIRAEASAPRAKHHQRDRGTDAPAETLVTGSDPF